MSKNELIVSYRKVRHIIKSFPFIYTAVLLVISPLEAWLSLMWAEVLALLTTTSIPTAWLCWRLSKAVKLCPWHRAQCFIMLLPLVIPLCRILCPEADMLCVWGGVSIILLASLVNCYLVFIKTTISKKINRK